MNTSTAPDNAPSSFLRRPWFVPLLFIFAFFFGLYGGYMVGDLLREKEEYNKNLVRAKNIAYQVDGVALLPAMQAISPLAQHPLVIETANSIRVVDNRDVLELLGTTRHLLKASLVYILDKDGTAVACTPYGQDGRKTLTGKNYQFREYFSQALQEHRISIYAALGITTNKRGIYIGHPVGPVDQPTGVVVIKLDMESIDQVLAAEQYPCIWCSSDGVVFASNRPEYTFRTIVPIKEERLQELHKSRQFADMPLAPLAVDLTARHVQFAEQKFHVTRVDTRVPGWFLVLLMPETKNISGLVLGSMFFGGISGLLACGCLIGFWERRDSRRQLSSHAERLELALAGGNLGTWDWHLPSNTVRFDQRWAEMKGYTLAEIKPSLDSWKKLVHPEDLPLVTQKLEEHFSGKTTSYEAEFRMRRNSGKWMWILDRGKVVARDDKNSPIRACGTHLDITPQKQLEQELIKEHHKFITILDAVPVGVMIINKDRTILWLNRFALKLAGFSRLEDVVGKQCGEYLCPAQQNACPVLDLGQKVDNSERIFQNHQGVEFQIVKTVSTIEFEQKQAFLETFVDITERKKLESELAEAQKLESVGRLAAGVAHEINTPIQFISTNLSFLQKSFADLFAVCDSHAELLARGRDKSINEELLTRHENIREEADIDFYQEELPLAIRQSIEGVERIAVIVRSMQEFALPGEKEPTASDLNAAIQATATVAHNEYENVAILHTELDPALPLVSCLLSEINQVLFNLLINARDAIAEQQAGNTAEKGVISITSGYDENWAKITVCDTGTGISEGIQHKIFDPFFTTKEVGKGTGQGLTIARQVIVDKHRGRLEVKNRDGGGACVAIFLPLKEH